MVTIYTALQHVTVYHSPAGAREARWSDPDIGARMVPFRPYEEPFGLPFTRPYRGPGVAR